jgi:hypothetical protein
MVGEQGPELVRLPVGSMVRSNPDTLRMLGAGGGPVDVTVHMDLQGAPDEFLRWLRHSIRVTGGRGTDSVQRSLGYRA